MVYHLSVTSDAKERDGRTEREVKANGKHGVGGRGESGTEAEGTREMEVGGSGEKKGRG